MSARNAYLASQVHTASQPKLRLMLIQAALRTAQQCLDHWATPRPANVDHALTQLRQVIGQLLGSLGNGNSETGAKLRELYGYLYRTAAQAQLENDADKLRDVVRVLEAEQNTWRQLAERHAAQYPEDAPLVTPAKVPQPPNENRSQNRRGLSQCSRVGGAKWDCPFLSDGAGIGSKSYVALRYEENTTPQHETSLCLVA